jgi:colanic acid/amylovoran biosynthesis protein
MHPQASMTENKVDTTREALDAPDIFLIGLTSVSLGGMEGYNLGNYAIIEPLVEGLRREFPAARIATSIQMSDAFCERFGLVARREPRFWTYGRRTLVSSMVDTLRVAAWRLTAPLAGRAADRFLEGSALLSELRRADLVIDFSGDLFGDNAKARRFLEGSLELLLARTLGRPVVLFAGSPGPFTSRWRRWLARQVINRADLVINREPLSEGVVRSVGRVRTPIRTAACPSFLFDGHRAKDIAGLLRDEGLEAGADARPLVGVIVCGWNMPTPPYDRVPRPVEELEPFLPLLRYLRDDIGARVVLMSHSHRVGSQGALHGHDAVIVEQLAAMAGPDTASGSITVLEGLYDAATMKALIGRLDMLISGRIHGAVSGLSQGVPTAIIDYGHEPKAHKLRGFARLMEIEECVCSPLSSDEMVRTATEVWRNRHAYRERLERRAAVVRADASAGFTMLKELLRYPSMARTGARAPHV